MTMPVVHHSSSLGICASLAPQSLTFPNGAVSTMPSVLANGVPDSDIISSSANDMCRVCANSRRFLADNHRYAIVISLLFLPKNHSKPY